MNKCGTCRHFIGAGDFDLCCMLHMRRLCYKDDDACERWDEKTIDRDSTIEGLQRVADTIHEYTDKPWLHAIEVDCELVLNALSLLKDKPDKE